ncbi:MAG: hypothetical protein Q7V04_02325, partial [Deltaproteobacteria bacterium]|nr:hypothetical protein [Deltaproteobacteria bacterium]
ELPQYRFGLILVYVHHLSPETDLYFISGHVREISCSKTAQIRPGSLAALTKLASSDIFHPVSISCPPPAKGGGICIIAT